MASPVTIGPVLAADRGNVTGMLSRSTTGAVPALTRSIEVTLLMTQVGGYNDGYADSLSLILTTVAVPGAPTNVNATAGNAQATVSWSAPASAGGSAMSSYMVTSSPAGGSATLTCPCTAPLSKVVTGLTNGTSYTFTVVAANAQGTSAPSAPSNSVTPIVPSGPTTTAGLSGTAGTNGWYRSNVTVTLTAAAGSAPISSTRYKIDNGPQQTYTGPFTVTGDSTGHTVEYWSTDQGGLTEATKTATIMIDTTPPSTLTGSYSGPLGSNGWYRGTGNETLTATDSTSGVASIMRNLDGGTSTAYSAPFAITGDGAHTVTAPVTDNAGNTATLTASNLPVKIDTTAPTATLSAPACALQNADGTCTGSATVTWTAPDDSGASSITSYTVTVNPGGRTEVVHQPCWPACVPVPTSATIYALMNGTSYSFTVVATNSYGSGLPSAPSNTVVPQQPAPPSAPTNVTATISGRKATVTWTEPASNGSPIGSYRVTAVGDPNKFVDVFGSPPPTSATIADLVAGMSYTFTVAAWKGQGGGATSAPSNAVVPNAPGPITYVVNDMSDVVDAAPGDNVCATASGKCTLRAAIQEANARGRATITLPAGTYTLTIAGDDNAFERTWVANLPIGTPSAAIGDLDLEGDITINGAGSGTTIIQGGTSLSASIDRVFDHRSGFVTLFGVTVRYGKSAWYGGGIFQVGGVLTLDNVVVSDNSTSASAGGIHIASYLSAQHSAMKNNTASHGGGIWVAPGASAFASDVTISGNTNAGVVNGGIMRLTDSTVSGNTGTKGGGIHNFGSILEIISTTVTDSSASDKGGGVYTDWQSIANFVSASVGVSLPNVGSVDSNTLAVSVSYTLVSAVSSIYASVGSVVTGWASSIGAFFSLRGSGRLATQTVPIASNELRSASPGSTAGWTRIPAP